jgi:hypothetical protein
MMAREDLIAALGATPGVLADFLAEVSPAELRRRRGQGFWTLGEHLEHLVQVQEVLLHRLELIQEREGGVITPYVPEEHPPGKDAGAREGEGHPGQRGVRELLEEFTRLRRRQLRLIEAADETLWARTAVHPEYERYGFRILVRHVLFHDGFHLARMEELWIARDEVLTRL